MSKEINKSKKRTSENIRTELKVIRTFSYFFNKFLFLFKRR